MLMLYRSSPTTAEFLSLPVVSESHLQQSDLPTSLGYQKHLTHQPVKVLLASEPVALETAWSLDLLLCLKLVLCMGSGIALCH